MNGDIPSLRLPPSRLPAAWPGLPSPAAAWRPAGCGRPWAALDDAAAAGRGPMHNPVGAGAGLVLEPPGWRAGEGPGRPVPGYPR
jgi:hypothetical protein